MKKRWVTVTAIALAFCALSSSAAFAQGWDRTNNKWFYWQEDGTVARNMWITNEAGQSYWVQENGEMASAQWVYDNEAWYYVGSSGEKQTNQILELDGNKKYWLGEDGRMAVNQWIQNDGKWYYFQEDGSAVTSKWYTIDGEEYYFLKSGVMAADALVPGGGRVDASGRKIRN